MRLANLKELYHFFCENITVASTDNSGMICPIILNPPYNNATYNKYSSILNYLFGPMY
jgi:tRNA1(Val) A37 N6-methylase TrmN6